MITECLHRIAVHQESLTRDEARAAMAEILEGNATDAQIAGLLVALHMKGETVEEIVGFAQAIRAAATPMLEAQASLATEAIAKANRSAAQTRGAQSRGRQSKGRRGREADNREAEFYETKTREAQVSETKFREAKTRGNSSREMRRGAESDSNFAAATGNAGADPKLDLAGTERDALVDTCGTGGDVSGTFNISTATALVVAGAGVRVAKHGNRSVSSLCGSADVMEALGVKLMLPPSRLARCLREVGIAFLYAPAMHVAMRYAQAVRRELKMRTVFNLLGPLTNPAGASAQVVGVYAAPLVEKLARALQLLGCRRAFVVHGSDGLDEISISAPTKVAEVKRGELRVYEISPEQFGMRRAPLEQIAGGDARQNAKIIREILEGEKSARRDVVLLNAAAALVAAGRAGDVKGGIALAAESLDSGKAKKKLEALVEFTGRKR